MFTLDCIFIIMTLRPPRSKRTDPLSPYTTLFRSSRCPLQDGKTIADYQMLIAKCVAAAPGDGASYGIGRSEEHTSELQSLMRISYADFCSKKKKTKKKNQLKEQNTHTNNEINNHTVNVQLTTRQHQLHRSQS